MPPQPLTEIFNFLPLSDRIATSGQPTIEQFRAIAESGYQTIINLALPSSTHAIANEPEIIESLGMRYIHIPVLWETPTLEDLDTFFNALDATDAPVFVHCAMNMRASAFIYLYRRIRLGINPETAQSDLERIWTPNPVWSTFIQQALQHYQQ